MNVRQFAVSPDSLGASISVLQPTINTSEQMPTDVDSAQTDFFLSTSIGLDTAIPQSPKTQVVNNPSALTLRASCDDPTYNQRLRQLATVFIDLFIASGSNNDEVPKSLAN